MINISTLELMTIEEMLTKLVTYLSHVCCDSCNQ